jgi:DNA-binding IclR family transcriptional regulator
MTVAGYLKRLDTGFSYDLTVKGWALAKAQLDLERVKQNRLAALERLSLRERRSLMQAAVS